MCPDENITNRLTFTNVKVMESFGKIRDEMEEAFSGRIPENLDDTIKEGEDLLEERLHTLKIADEFGWPAVRVFEKEDLARNDKEEKKYLNDIV